MTEVSTLAGAMASEAAIQASFGALPPGRGKLVASQALSSLSQASRGAILSPGFVCECLAAAASACQRPEVLTNTSAPEATSLANYLLAGSSSLDPACSLSVLRVLEGTVSASSILAQDSVMVKSLTGTETAFLRQLQLTALGLASGESSSSVGGSSASLVSKTPLSATSPTGISIQIPFAGPATAIIPAGVGASIGKSLARVGATGTIGVHLAGIAATPPVGGIVPVTPLVSLMFSDGLGAAINVSGLPVGMELTVTLPITVAVPPPRPGKWWYGSYICLYWSASLSSFATGGCTAVKGTAPNTVVITTSHLTMFTVQPLYENYTAPTPAPVTTPAPVFSASISISEGVVAKGGGGAYAGYAVVVASASSQGAWGTITIAYTLDGSAPGCKGGTAAKSASQTFVLTAGAYTVRASACHMSNTTGGSVQKTIVVEQAPEVLVVVGMPGGTTVSTYGITAVSATIAKAVGVSASRASAASEARRSAWIVSREEWDAASGDASRRASISSLPSSVRDRVAASGGTMGAFGIICTSDADAAARTDSLNKTDMVLPDGKRMTLEYTTVIGGTPTPAPSTTPVPKVPLDTVTIAIIGAAIGVSVIGAGIFLIYWRRRARKAKVATEKAQKAADDAHLASRKGLPPLQTDGFNPQGPPRCASPHLCHVSTFDPAHLHFSRRSLSTPSCPFMDVHCLRPDLPLRASQSIRPSIHPSSY